MATKFKFVKKVEGEVNGYRGTKVKTGDTVELDDIMAFKAALNPDYELVKAKPGPKPKAKPALTTETAEYNV